MAFDLKEIRRQYFCICEGQQEEMYLKYLSRLLQTDKRRITFTIRQGLPGDIQKQRSIKYDKAVLFDHDGNTVAFRNTLNTCIKNKCSHAYSNRNFDLWLLLHKQDFSSSVSDNQTYKKDIRNFFNLDAEADIKSEKVINQILNQITLPDIKDAIQRAQRIREQKIPSDANRIGSIIYYDNPDLSIHEFIIKVFSECNEPLLTPFTEGV